MTQDSKPTHTPEELAEIESLFGPREPVAMTPQDSKDAERANLPLLPSWCGGPKGQTINLEFGDLTRSVLEYGLECYRAALAQQAAPTDQIESADTINRPKVTMYNQAGIAELAEPCGPFISVPDAQDLTAWCISQDRGMRAVSPPAVSGEGAKPNPDDLVVVAWRWHELGVGKCFDEDRPTIVDELHMTEPVALVELDDVRKLLATPTAGQDDGRDGVDFWLKLYRRLINCANGLTNYVDERAELRQIEKALSDIEAMARVALAKDSKS